MSAVASTDTSTTFAGGATVSSAQGRGAGLESSVRVIASGALVFGRNELFGGSRGRGLGDAAHLDRVVVAADTNEAEVARVLDDLLTRAHPALATHGDPRMPLRSGAGQGVRWNVRGHEAIRGVAT
jgi:hypothetical protein